MSLVKPFFRILLSVCTSLSAPFLIHEARYSLRDVRRLEHENVRLLRRAHLSLVEIAGPSPHRRQSSWELVLTRLSAKAEVA